MTATDQGVVVVGSLNVDVTLRVAQLPTAGETVLARDRSINNGGKGANQAVAAASQGGPVRFVGAVGDDAEGRSSLAVLADRGVDVSAVDVVPGGRTGTAMVLVADDGENLIVVDQASNGSLSPQWVRGHIAACEPDVVLAQLEVPVASVLAAAQAWDPRFFVLNPAPMPPDPSVMAPLLPHVDILVPNRPELAAMVAAQDVTTLEDVDRCARELAFHGVLVVTLGSLGAAIYAPGGQERTAHIPAERVEVVDTTGAGDAFCGVLADRLARGWELVDAVASAVRLAAVSTTVHGAQVPQPFVDPLPHAG